MTKINILIPDVIRRRFLPFFSIVLSLLVSLGEARADLPDFSAGILNPTQVLAKAADVTSEHFPNADDVLVDDHIVTEYQADGRAVTYDDTFMKILTEKGKRENKILSRHFVLPYSRASYELIEVYRPGGAVLKVNVSEQSREMVDRSQMGSNIYNPNSKLLQVTVPELEIGDVLRYVAKHEIVKPRVPNTWSEYEVLEYTSPICHFVYEVRGPKTLPLKSIALKDPVEGTVSFKEQDDGSSKIYRWEVNDVPRMYSEPSMPPLHTVVQRLLISTIPSWQDISKWYWKLSEPHLEATPEMKKKVEELTAGVADETEKLRAIFRFVSQEVRYMGITVEKEAPGYEPHDVSLTFENRHGVCRDKAALLVSMLRLAGLKGFPVLIHNGPKKDREVPQPFFNHAIAAVENSDGAYTLMDPTDENTKDLFPAYLCNQSYLVARPEGEDLRTSPIIPAAENMMLVETTARVDDDGNLTGSAVLRFAGINDNAYRGYFSRIQPIERRRFFEGVVKRMAAGTRLTAIRIEPEDMMNTEVPLKIDLSFEADEILVSDGHTVMMPVPRLGTSVGMVNFVLRRAGLEKRKYPLETDFACGVRETLNIELSPSIGSAVSIPSYDPIEDETLTWRRKLAMDGNTLRGESEFMLNVVEFDPEQYLRLRETLKVLEINARKKPIFERTEEPAEEPADSIVLDSRLDYTISDETSWTVTETCRRKILTYKGKKDHSELKWDHNPAWHDVKLIRAVVINGDKEKAISEQEINVMDAGWVGSAPRYSPGKTLVASLPGVEVGSIIEYEVTHHYFDRPFFATRMSFAGFDPVDSMALTIDAPAELDVEIQFYPHGVLDMSATENVEVTTECSEDSGRVRRVWHAENIAAAKREQRLPPWWAFTPTVFASTGEWRTYARDLRRRFLDAASDDKGTGAVVKPMLDTYGRRSQELLKAIRDWHAKQIRQSGPGLNELPLSAVSSASTTLSEGYGNVTDRAILLYALLKEGGFRPEFVLTGWAPLHTALRDALASHPAQHLFPDVLVRVKTEGRWCYLNDTSQYSVLGATEHDGRLGLSLKKARLTVIEADPDKQDRQETFFTVKLSDDGTAAIRKESISFGDAYGSRNRKFSEMPPEERVRYHQETLAALSQSAVADGDLVTSFDTYPGREILSANVADFATPDGEYYYLTVPASLTNLLGLRADKRTQPIYWDSKREFCISTEIVYPPGYPVSVLRPEAFTWQTPEGTRVDITWQENRSENSEHSEHTVSATLVHKVVLAPAVMGPDAYDELLAVNRRLSHSAARTLLLKKPQQDGK